MPIPRLPIHELPPSMRLMGIDAQALSSRLELTMKMGAGAAAGSRLQKLAGRIVGSGDFSTVEVEPGGDGVATISLVGEFVEVADPVMAWLGIAQVAYGDAIDAVNSVLGNGLVSGVRLYIDSPGGAVMGFEPFFEALAELVAAKPVVGVFRNCHSMAQWAALAVPVENTCILSEGRCGNIGIKVCGVDTSKAYEMAGLAPFVVASGKQKVFFGMDGLPVTPEHKANMQRVLVDPVFAEFKAQAMASRGLADNDPVFEGLVLTPAEAKAAGLVAEFGTTAEMNQWATDRLNTLINNGQTTMTKQAPTTTTPPATEKPEGSAPATAAPATAPNPQVVGAATAEELAAAFPGEDAFCFKQLTGKQTLLDAHKAYGLLQKGRADEAAGKVTALTTKVAELEGAATRPATPGNPRVNPAGPGADAAGAVADTGKAEDYEKHVEKLKGSMPVDKAHGQAQKDMPGAYGEWLKKARRR